MNIEKYISSGILEAYVLNDLGIDQKREVEDLAEEHMEIKDEILRIQNTLEQWAMMTAVQPAGHVKQAILDKIDGNATETSVIEEIAEDKRVITKTEEPRTVEKKIEQKSQQPWIRYSLAAAVALFILSSVAAVYFYNQWKGAEQEISQLVAQNQAITQQYSTVTSQKEDLDRNLAIAINPEFNRVDLNGLDISPDSKAIVYWNQSSNEVYLNSAGMPQPDGTNQYQLWAIVDGKPVDAGVFDINNAANLMKMKNITNATAFAVTLEPKGGSKNPTLDAMYVMGEV